MQRRRTANSPESKNENMEVAATKGWRAVFAGGRWGDEGGEEVKGWQASEEAIPFVSECRALSVVRCTDTENSRAKHDLGVSCAVVGLLSL